MSGTPFIKRFRTSRQYYVYDVNTNQILDVDASVYDILGDYGRRTQAEIERKYGPKHGRKCVQDALDEIEEKRREHGLFLADRPQAISLGLSRDELEGTLAASVKSITLGLTERCNLSCDYCSVRTLTAGRQGHMSESTALGAIDFLHAHSGDVDEVGIGFYGGEPLLNFRLLKRCVRHALRKFGRQGVRFNMTTNGVLMDAAKAAFLADHKVSVRVSVDGPRAVHDRYRKTLEGGGSYDAAMAALLGLLQAYGRANAEKLGIFMTLTPPYDLDANAALWREEPWLPSDMYLLANYVNGEHSDFAKRQAVSGTNRMHWITRNRHFRAFKRALAEGGEPTPFDRAFFERGLLRIHKRDLWRPPRKVYPLNGSCIPGARKLFVTADGQLRMCERAHGCPPIGSVRHGYDLEGLLRVIGDYAEAGIRDCRKCWAVGLCSLCFAHGFRDGELAMERKRPACRQARESLGGTLKRYCSVLEENANAFDYMDEMTLG